jgi:hypothetical protein
MVRRERKLPVWRLRPAIFAILALGATTSSSMAVPDPLFWDDLESGAVCRWSSYVGFAGACSAPANDTCQNATALTIGLAIAGTNIGATSDYDSGLETCTGYAQPGGDVAYSVLLASSQQITVTLSSVASTLDAAIALIGPGSPSVCDAAPVTCLAGADLGVFGEGETFMYTTSSTGTYYILVDTYASVSSGNFMIEVTSP